MTDSTLVQHLPAVKVGGRRLSISTKHKHHAPSEPTPVEQNDEASDTDYPRPAAPSDEHPQAHPQHVEDEAPLKKEKKHGGHENEKQPKELAHRKIETTRPTRDVQSVNKGFGASGRIAQPAGKGLGI